MVHKYQYFFGFGADFESDMIKAVIGRNPEKIGEAILKDHQLSIQSLEDMPTSGHNQEQY